MGTKVPAGLKDRILSDSLPYRRKRGALFTSHIFRRFATAAVIAVVFMGLAVSMRSADVSVVHGGYEVGYSAYAVDSEFYPVSVTESRYNGPDGVHIAVRQLGSCKIEAGCGRLYILKDGDEFVSDAGVPFSLSGGAEIIWDTFHREGDCVLTVTKWGRVSEYVLRFDPENKMYTISRKAV